MAIVDYDQGVTSVKDQVSRNKKYKTFKDDVKKLKKKAGSSFEKAAGKVSTSLNNAKKNQKKSQRNIKTQLDIDRLSGNLTNYNTVFSLTALLENYLVVCHLMVQGFWFGESSYYKPFFALLLYHLPVRNASTTSWRILYNLRL
jgi:hypothetical protein